ncbi:uncharacterized protein C1orf94-like [Falco peregrinus]|uniref:uncharacterized protein C1orf94-like n=1 Tax=Falco peregrinus TaxID=8954 RepID=UPI002479C501|nr:uncharacterized protein C1orf94-like [Falco peregrinus]
MLPGTNMAPTPVIISEGQLPLGPVPRHTWIHEDTPPDSLDEACHEIWKRVQLLADRLHAPVLVPPLQHILCSELSATFQKHRIDSLSSNYLPDEPEGLKSICKAMIGNREREMKLRALCNAQLSAKPMIPSLLRSVNSQKNSKGLEGGSVTGAHSVEGSKLELPFLLKHTDSAKGADNQVTAEETKEAKQLIQNSTSSSANSSTTVSLTTTAQSQAPGQKQQLLPSAEICSKTDSDAVTKNPVTTTALDKKKKKMLNAMQVLQAFLLLH